jgi:putative oxidoreductase
MSTVAELLLSLALILGLFTRLASFLSGLLLFLFALAMTFALGIESPLNLSVFTASAASFLLATCPKFPLSLDRMRRKSE